LLGSLRRLSPLLPSARARWLFLGVAVAVLLWLSPSWPTEQHIRIRLGEARDQIVEVRVRCGTAEGAEWTREVTFRYAKGQAPRIVSYEPRLVSGEVLLEIEQTTSDGRVRTTDRHLRLEGGTTSIDVSDVPSPPTGHTD
jgi:hypothetical protein